MKRISEKSVVDRKQFKGKMMFIDKEGYVCIADRPQKLTPEERATRLAARMAKKQEKKKQGAKFRENIVLANKVYRKVVKSKNLGEITKSLKALDVAKEEYEKFKGK
jgi:beta-galactosidase GanA